MNLPTPAELKQEFGERLDMYTKMYEQRAAAEKESCVCTKMVQGLCRRCQKINGLTSQLHMLHNRSLPRLS